MNKYNVIEPTTNLDALQTDYDNWCSLPYDMRKLSNDDCIRIHGCTVPDLYYKYREAILQAQDMQKVDTDNIVRLSESTVLNKYEHSKDLLSISKRLQESPFIVIIDPDIQTKEELQSRMDSFNSLNSKNRAYSNDYSWQIWGYNVVDMFTIMSNEINKKKQENDEDDNNIKFVRESSVVEGKVLNTMIPTFDRYLNCAVNSKHIEKNKYEFLNESSIVGSTVANYHIGKLLGIDSVMVKHNLESMDCTIMSCNIPLFTPESMFKINPNFKLTDCDYMKEIKKIIESGNSEDIVEAGWIPTASVDNLTALIGRQFQIDNIDALKYINISDIMEDVEIGQYNCDQKLYPMYLIFNYENEEDEFCDVNSYNKVGICFSLGYKSIIYTFTGEDTEFRGFKKEYDYEGFIDVVACYLDIDTLNKLKETCEKLSTNPGTINYAFGSIYTILKRTKNPSSKDNLKIIFKVYLDMILRLLCCDLDQESIDPNRFNPIKDANLFKVYSGEYKMLDQETINRINNVIDFVGRCDNGVKKINESVNTNTTHSYLFNKVKPILKINE